MLAKLRRGLKKTAQLLQTDVRDLFVADGRLLDEQYLDELLGINIKTDMGYQSAEQIVQQVRQNMRGRVVTTEQVVATWKATLKELMAQEAAPLQFAATGPTVILVCGVNGSGKTTSIAKLAHMLRLEGKRVVLAAADTFRAAAVEQLTIWAERSGVEIVTGAPGSSPPSVAYRAVDRARELGADVCIVDTAGRLQTQKNLMAELTKVQTTLRKQIPDAPHEVLLVLDATTGQNGISQASKFTQAVHCTGIILAKLDGTAKGGVVVAIRQLVGLPVKFVGVGEHIEDLARFDADSFVDALFEDLVPGAGGSTGNRPRG
ncbi:MAG: signal recognition particle-docking protein FtsY [Planctomycetes bacterium RBG_16_64_10]|nr:MAG: signal recognition particle-docking protein FtsY [Planctomycetes bacterium RBG_16_64_10]